MIIGLCGLPGSGKDTVADYLFTEGGYEIRGFSDQLKKMTAQVFGYSYDMLQARTEGDRLQRSTVDPRYGKTPVKILEELGLALREIHPTILVESALNSAASYDSVITDVRYPNEVDAIKESGGKLVMIERGETPDWVRRLRSFNVSCNIDLEKFGSIRDLIREDIHEAQWRLQCQDSLSRMDYVIRNDGSIGMLEAQVKGLLL